MQHHEREGKADTAADEKAKPNKDGDGDKMMVKSKDEPNANTEKGSGPAEVSDAEEDDEINFFANPDIIGEVIALCGRDCGLASPKFKYFKIETILY